MRLGKRPMLVAGLMLAASPALALLAPEYYQKARETAPDVVVVKVAGVSGPDDASGFGTCTVAGTVAGAERGTRYAVGAAITIPVPCRKQGAQPMPGPVLWTDFDQLQAAPYGRAWLEADGKLALYQYQLLAAKP